MSKFYTYFKEKLKFFFLWYETPFTPVFKGISHIFDETIDDIKWLRRQFNVYTCDEEYLKRYGNARGVERLPYEDYELWKNRVQDCYNWYNKKAGKTSTIKTFLDQKLDEEEDSLIPNIIEYRDKKLTAYDQTIQRAEIFVKFKAENVKPSDKIYAKQVISEFKRASIKPIYSLQLLPSVEASTKARWYTKNNFKLRGPQKPLPLRSFDIKMHNHTNYGDWRWDTGTNWDQGFQWDKPHHTKTIQFDIKITRK